MKFFLISAVVLLALAQGTTITQLLYWSAVYHEALSFTDSFFFSVFGNPQEALHKMLPTWSRSLSTLRIWRTSWLPMWPRSLAARTSPARLSEYNAPPPPRPVPPPSHTRSRLSCDSGSGWSHLLPAYHTGPCPLLNTSAEFTYSSTNPRYWYYSYLISLVLHNLLVTLSNY